MKNLTIAILLFTINTSCSSDREQAENQSQKIQYDTLNVVATAYNSIEAQTKKGSPALAAWGDTLKPGMKAIAISRDLIDSGLVHNTAVKIEGFEGTFLVKDKMNKRWTNKIDIYMGVDVDSARSWGKQSVAIYVPIIEVSEEFPTIE